ncbi:protein NOI4 isoform X1 [Populus nigra]|uniref:protein NOI4 isoform X1 n=1 Tax=Populus nigra TaxID=3691 RepID=UPI002B26A868|nr:protein NOI4 isoform X1 [Populus nigra]
MHADSCVQDTGRPLPKFGEWDVNDPASAEGFTVIFNKARDEKKTGGKPESPGKVDDSHVKSGVNPAKPQAKKWFCCIQSPPADS